MQTITGNTYPVKEDLKALGGKWNPAAQGWDIPDINAAKARELVAAAGPNTYVPRGSNRRRRTRYAAGYTRFSSGAESFRNPHGRCEDAPCCGCCS